MEPALTIRPAEKTDAATVQLLLEELAASTGKPGAILGNADSIQRFGFGPSPLFQALIARGSGVDIGLLLCFPEYSSWRGLPGIYVQDLYVVDSARGGGVARALLAEAARRCSAIGGSYLRLSAAADNQAAQDFYRKVGFREAGDECLFVLEGDGFAALEAG